MSLKDAFDSFAASYDASRRKLIPCLDAFYGTLLDVAPFTPDQSFCCLDLGAGTGLASGLLAARFPKARFLLVDLSDGMLGQARRRFGQDLRFQYSIMDYAAAALPGPVDLIVSSLSIHHLTDDQKRGLFAKAHAAVNPGAAFLMADLVKAPTPAGEACYQVWWESAAARAGATPAEWADAKSRRKHDLPATLTDQLAWLAEAGFVEVDCWFKHYPFAVFGGFKDKN
jgi:tRNA (cmo5U34)-methyltransferase